MLRSSNLWFFVLLSMNFWLVPLLSYDDPGDTLTDGLISVTLLGAVALQGILHRQFRLAASLAGVVILAAIAIEELIPQTAYVENGTFALCFAAVTVLFFRTITGSLSNVTFDTVFAAASTYILIGMFFASIFGLVIEANPEAFTPVGSVTSRFDLIFYSFATLTTLGAPLAMPSTDLSRMLTVLEATLGLIYIAILVGSIVGAFSAKLSAKE